MAVNQHLSVIEPFENAAEMCQTVIDSYSRGS
jgi:hypothetical protein